MTLVRSKRPLAGDVVFASSLADSELCVMSICSRYWLAHKSIHCVDDPRYLDFSLLRSFSASGPFRSGGTEKGRAQDIGTLGSVESEDCGLVIGVAFPSNSPANDIRHVIN
jgi:hypothetical protein